MKTKKYSMTMLGILLVISLMLVLTGCKKKVPSANAASSEKSSYEQESMQLDQPDESFSYLQAEDTEDEEPSEDPNGYPEEEPNEEPDEPDNEEPDDEPKYPDEQPDEDPNAPEDEPNDSPEEDPNESWL